MARYIQYTPTAYQSMFVPRNVEGYQKMLETLQAKQDRANEMIASRYDEFLKTEYQNEPARQKAQQEILDMVDNLNEKTGGDLARGYKEVLSTVNNIASLKFWNLNKKQMDFIKEHKDDEKRWGAFHFYDNNPMDMELLDENGEWKDPNDLQYTSTNLEDAVKYNQLLYDQIHPDIYQSPYTKINGGRHLQSIITEGITPEKYDLFLNSKEAIEHSNKFIKSNENLRKILASKGIETEGDQTEWMRKMAYDMGKDMIYSKTTRDIVSNPDYRHGSGNTPTVPTYNPFGVVPKGTVNNKTYGVSSTLFKKNERNDPNNLMRVKMGDPTIPAYGSFKDIIKHRDKIEKTIDILPEGNRKNRLKEVWNNYIATSGKLAQNSIGYMFGELSKIYDKIDNQKLLGIEGVEFPSSKDYDAGSIEGLSEQYSKGNSIDNLVFEGKTVWDLETNEEIDTQEWYKNMKKDKATSYQIKGRIGPQNPLSFENPEYIGGLMVTVNGKNFVLADPVEMGGDYMKKEIAAWTDMYQRTVVGEGEKYPIGNGAYLTFNKDTWNMLDDNGNIVRLTDPNGKGWGGLDYTTESQTGNYKSFTNLWNDYRTFLSTISQKQ